MNARSRNPIEESRRLIADAHKAVGRAQEVLATLGPEIAKGKARRSERLQSQELSRQHTREILEKLEAAGRDIQMLKAEIEAAAGANSPQPLRRRSRG